MTIDQRFDFFDTSFAEVKRFIRKPIEDHRGYFARLYCVDEFSSIGIKHSIAQINYSMTRKRGAIRGFHYQLPPFAESKIVICQKGKIFDVVVDIRKESETFLKWYGVELSANNQNGMVIPPGFAHGFQTLAIDTEIIYFVTEQYKPSAEAGLQPLDPAIGVTWPIKPSEISQKDRNRPFIDRRAFGGVCVD